MYVSQGTGMLDLSLGGSRGGGDERCASSMSIGMSGGSSRRGGGGGGGNNRRSQSALSPVPRGASSPAPSTRPAKEGRGGGGVCFEDIDDVMCG